MAGPLPLVSLAGTTVAERMASVPAVGQTRCPLELAPGLAGRVRGGRRQERFVGTANTRNFLCKPFGPGWALVGDAGYHKDRSGDQRCV